MQRTSQADQVEVLIDRDIYEHLKADSTFEDTVSTVLRRELGLMDPTVARAERDDGGASRDEVQSARATSSLGTRPPGRRAKARRSRAAAGTLLPESEYHRPILEILADNGGRLAKQAVIHEVGRRLGDRLTEADRDTLESGGVRWESRAQFARLRLADRGFIDKNAPRGIWALTPEGQAALEEGPSSLG